jgi:alpha-N-arabinofuranosidase
MTNDTSAVRQTIFYPFADASRYGRGTALRSVVKCGTHQTKRYGDVPDIAASAVFNAEKDELVLFIVNRDGTDTTLLESDLRQFEGKRILMQEVYTADTLRTANDFSNPFAAVPHEGNYADFKDGKLTASIAPYSWNVIRIG